MFGFTLAGLAVGFAVGATGVGGGALMTPLLILLFGVAPAVAVGTDLLYAAITKGFGVYLHRTKGTVEWRIVGLLACGSVPASLITIAIMRQVGVGEAMESIIVITLCAAIILTGLMTLLREQLRSLSQHERFDFLKVAHRRLRTPLTIFSGVVLGVVVTLSSVGAGVIGAVILLLLYPRLPAISVVGTDLAHAVPLTAIAGIGHMSLGTVDVPMLGYLLLGSIPGIYLGTRIGFRLPDHVLRPVIAGVLILIAIGLFSKTALAAFT
ncbi:MAG: sulfite exporter TauE/SafE family protein [Salinisphaeraceae bacterium]|nr:sulfite exporter TauE/SafE family protein [Salinisphaeraceae bacterium]